MPAPARPGAPTPRCGRRRVLRARAPRDRTAPRRASPRRPRPPPLRRASTGTPGPPSRGARACPPGSAFELVRDVAGQAIGGDALLLEGVAIAHRNGAVLGGLPVDRDPEGCARLVLTAVAPSDAAAVVVERIVRLAEVVEDAAGQLRHAV